MAQKIVAFVAKSFDPIDEAKIAPITKFLDSFKTLGFITQSAEPSEVESVSEKVRSLIDESHVLIAIFTRRYPVYDLRHRLATAISVFRGKLMPSLWSAPPWVLQESGYALKAEKSLILFRETGVEIPGLQGDLEYIPFDPQNPTPALQRASEMISKLIAKAGSIRVEVNVQSEAGEVKGAETGASLKPSESASSQDEVSSPEEDFKIHIFALYKAVASKDREVSGQQYEVGLDWIRAHRPVEELFWRCFYQKTLFDEGETDALAELRIIADENKGEFLPLSYLAACLVDLHEYDEAVECYLKAASLADPDQRARLEIDAAGVLQKAKKASESREILLKLRGADYAQQPTTQFRILKNLYSLSKELEDEFASFAIGELALHQRPEETSFRFSLAFDYNDAEHERLALYHYKILCDQDQSHSSGLNNLAVASQKCGLAVLAAQRYKKAYALGETLAASNLGSRYLEAGLSDEALVLLKEAQNKQDCVPDVSRMVSAVYEKIQENGKDQEKVLARAEEQRNFLVAFARGLLSPSPANLEGRWKFPAAEIVVRRVASTLQGVREDRTQVNPAFYGLSSLLSGSTPLKPVTRVEKFEFSGTLSGRTCKFKLETSKHDEPSSWTNFALPSTSTIEGYVLFAEDGLSGKVAEIKNGKPEKYYVVSKSIQVH